MDIFTNVEKAVRVWSFDGGGRGVLSQLIIVDKLMRDIQWKQRLSEIPRPCDHADVMIGSGLGGAIAILMGRLRLTASEAYDDIVQLGRAVFMKPNPSLSKPIFSLDILKSTLGAILERHGYKSDMLMMEDGPSTKTCHVIALASSKDNVTGYKCLRTYASPKGFDCTVVDAIAATMAIPDWLHPVFIGSGFEEQNLIGGCMGYNNPTWEGLLEAKEIFGVDARVTSVISIGSTKTVSVVSAINKSRSGCVEQMNADCEQTAVRLSGYFRNVPAYLRIVMDTLADNADVYDWNERAIVIMNGRVTSYLERAEIRKDLDKAVANLLQEAGMTNLGQITQATAARIGARSTPRLTPYYIPRPEVNDFMEINLIGDNVEFQKMLVIHGMAGSGKTQSVSFFERKNRKRYKHVFFIDASSVTSIKADLQSAIRSLGGAHSQDTYEDALQYLKSTESGHWLVIFDNADDPNLPLMEFIPSCDHGHIIVTTRNPDLALLAPSSHLSMPKMDNANALAVLFLASQSPRAESHGDNEDALEICKLVGNLPLALVQVGCYCFSSRVSFSHYLARFREHRQRLMELRPSWRLDEYPHSAYTSISLSYSLLDEDVKYLLHLLAFFHPFNIHIDIFRASAQHRFDVAPEGQLLSRSEQHHQWSKGLENILITSGEWNQTRLDELLMRLQSLSLVSLTRDDDYTIATIHPLVQSFSQDILTADDFDRFLYMTTRTLSGCVWDEHLALFRYLLPHIYELENHKVDPHPNDTAAFAYLLSSMKLNEDALKRWRKVKAGCAERSESDHSSTLHAASRMAIALGHLGDYDAAIAEIADAIAIQEKKMGRDEDITVRFYFILASLLSDSGKAKEAEPILRTNLQILETRYGKENQHTLLTTSRLGLNLHHQGRFYEAEAILNETIPMTMRVFSDDINTSIAVRRLSLVLMKLGRWAEAETRLQQVLQWRVKKYGAENKQTLIILRDLALCIQHRGGLKDAERLQRFVLEVTKKHNGAGHKDTIKAQNALEETLRLIKGTNSNSDDTNAHRTGVWSRSKVEFVIIFVLAAFAAASIPVILPSWFSVRHK